MRARMGMRRLGGVNGVWGRRTGEERKRGVMEEARRRLLSRRRWSLSTRTREMTVPRLVAQCEEATKACRWGCLERRDDVVGILEEWN